MQEMKMMADSQWQAQLSEHGKDAVEGLDHHGDMKKP
jgi:hypothetical protein